MLSGLTSRTSFIALIAAFLLHNIEEALAICRYPVENPFLIIQPANCQHFIGAVLIMSLIVVTLFIAAMWTKQPKVYLFISTAIAAGLVLNVLIPHIIIAIYGLDYTPGLVTAVLLNLPLGLLTLSKNKPKCTGKKQFHRFIGLGLVAGYLIFAIVMALTIFLVDY